MDRIVFHLYDILLLSGGRCIYCACVCVPVLESMNGSFERTSVLLLLLYSGFAVGEGVAEVKGGRASDRSSTQTKHT